MSVENGPGEKDVVGRINRYSSLRSVERALSPSVRRRLPLAGAGRRQGVLLRLQRLLDGALSRGATPIEPAVDVESLRSVDAELDGLSDRLAGTLRSTPLAQFRATLPGVVTRHRTDAVALLDFWLDARRPDADSLHLIDYLITLLATDEVDGQITVVADPSTVSSGVERACRDLQGSRSDPDAKRASEAASMLRASSVTVLDEDDLESTIVAMRSLKLGAADVYFDPDLLRSAVQYNATVKSRFAALLDADRARDAAVMRTLEALRALDEPRPGD